MEGEHHDNDNDNDKGNTMLTRIHGVSPVGHRELCAASCAHHTHTHFVLRTLMRLSRSRDSISEREILADLSQLIAITHIVTMWLIIHQWLSWWAKSKPGESQISLVKGFGVYVVWILRLPI